MHNLAVLYAEGVDGKPDYQTAAKWFRKAADCGVSDSQYNLGILYARGIGIEPNLAEAYKWFALAAREGDKEAAKKRDDVGARLDQSSLMAARVAARLVSRAQPETATQVKVPAGGWDAAAVPPAAKRGAGPKADAAPSALPINSPKKIRLRVAHAANIGRCAHLPAEFRASTEFAGHPAGDALIDISASRRAGSCRGHGTATPVHAPRKSVEPQQFARCGPAQVAPGPASRYSDLEPTITVQIYLPIADLPVNIFVILAMGWRSDSSPACLASAAAS